MTSTEYDAIKATVAAVFNGRVTAFWDDEPEAFNAYGLTARLSIVSDVGRNNGGSLEIERVIQADQSVREEVRIRRKAVVQVLLEATMPGTVPPGNFLAARIQRTKFYEMLAASGVHLVDVTTIADLDFQKGSRMLQSEAVSMTVFYTTLDDGRDEEPGNWIETAVVDGTVEPA